MGSRKETGFCLGLFAFVLATRALTSGTVYFGDGPAHLAAIQNGTFVIQPPGYWLFNRVGGLFPDPARGLLVFNWLCSGVGAVAFYLVCRRLTDGRTAKLGALLYSSIFFAWFSGNIHSTYASQLCFPVLMLLFMMRYEEHPRKLLVAAIAICFALCAGFRPSDGVFLAPALLYWVFRTLSFRQTMFCLGTAFVACLLWFVPNSIALHRYAGESHSSQLEKVATGAIVFGRINEYTASNGLRYFLPLTLSLGLLLPFIVSARGKAAPLLWVWVTPASLFFLLVYISDAPYLNCILPALVLLALMGVEQKLRPFLRPALIVAMIVVNLSFYLFFRPLPSELQPRLAVLLVNKDLGMYTRYAVKNRVMIRISNGYRER